MKLTYLGHSVVMIEEGKFKGIIDPFIKGNNNEVKLDDLVNITHIFVTHGHGDHLGDTVEIAKKNNSLIIANHEIVSYLNKFNVNTHAMHIGGKTKFDFGTVKMTNALHGSGISVGNDMIYGGNPCGFVIEVNGKKIYHAGDTGLTYDMKLLQSENVDVAFIPIGGNFTMDINDAVLAVDFIKPKKVVPIHYNTFDLIKADPIEFKKKVGQTETIILNINQSMGI
ncbi:MAG: metal-dependent hydrolase [Bacillota bacterium]|nr:metal-dependent hydrolase [Bacillota bacterium]